MSPDDSIERKFAGKFGGGGNLLIVTERITIYSLRLLRLLLVIYAA